MATVAATPPTAVPTSSSRYERFAGACAILTGVLGFLYSVAFVVLRQQVLYSLLLLVVGLLTICVLVALYQRVQRVDTSFAMLGLLLGLTGAIGTTVHGGYDMAAAIHPSTTVTDLPSAIDPRGLLTFGVAGLGLGVFAWLIAHPTSTLPRGLGYLGYIAALLLVLLYLARLIVVDPSNPLVLGPAALAGFVASPVWYVWLGLTLGRAR
jgi:hypothetical protein